MKKKFLSMLLIVVMAITCLATFTGCFGGGSTLHPLTEAEWQDYFDEANYSMRGVTFDGYSDLTKNSYTKQGVEYGKDLEFKGQTYDYYKVEDDKVESIESSEYVDYYTQIAPFFTFMHDNFANFTMHQTEDESMQIYVYNDQLPVEVKDCIDTMLKLTARSETIANSINYTYHSIVVVSNYQYLDMVAFMSGDYELIISELRHSDSTAAYMFEVGESEEYNAVKGIIRAEESAAFYAKVENSIKPVSTCIGENVNFVVKGGKGVDYQEFYFTDKGLRFYTPNAEQPQIAGDSNVYVDGIYYNDNGTYKYYKQNKQGAWSVQTIDKDRFESTILQLYLIYCGGAKWLTVNSIYYNDFDFSSSSLSIGSEFTDSTSFRPYYDAKFYKIKYTFENEMLQKVTWKMDMIPTSIAETLGATKLTYDFTLTVGNASFTVPNV